MFAQFRHMQINLLLNFKPHRKYFFQEQFHFLASLSIDYLSQHRSKAFLIGFVRFLQFNQSIIVIHLSFFQLKRPQQLLVAFRVVQLIKNQGKFSSVFLFGLLSNFAIELIVIIVCLGLWNGEYLCQWRRLDHFRLYLFLPSSFLRHMRNDRLSRRRNRKLLNNRLRRQLQFDLHDNFFQLLNLHFILIDHLRIWLHKFLSTVSLSKIDLFLLRNSRQRIELNFVYYILFLNDHGFFISLRPASLFRDFNNRLLFKSDALQCSQFRQDLLPLHGLQGHVMYLLDLGHSVLLLFRNTLFLDLGLLLFLLLWQI